MWQWFRGNDATEARIPISILALDGQCLDFAFQLAMQLNLDVADFRQLQFVREFESRLRVREGIVPMLALESRKARFLMALHSKEKGFERFVHAAENILQDL